MEIRIKIPFPDDPAKRAMVIAIVCSVLLHLVLLATLISVNTFGTPAYLKRGEPLMVDIAPDKPEEKAPLGNPSRPVGPEPEPPRKAPEPPAPRPQIADAPPPKAPKAPPAPKAPAPPRPAPEPPKQVAKAEPPAPKAPEPPKPVPAPEPAPKAAEPPPKAAEPPPNRPPEPAPVARPSAPAPGQPSEGPRPMVPPPAVPPGPAGERSGAQTALAKPATPPAPSIFRNPPAGGGGLRGGRGGVEGEPIPLDTPEPKYQDYFNKVREKIRANWIYPREAGDRGIQGELLLEFHIAKDGRVEYLELRNSSGAEILDRFAMNAVRLAQPFPPVPDDIAKKVLAINGIFRYQIIGASLLNQYLR